MPPPATAIENRLSCFFLGIGAWLMSPLPLLLTPLFHAVVTQQPIGTWSWLEILWLAGSISLFAVGLVQIGWSVVGRWTATDDHIAPSLPGSHEKRTRIATRLREDP